MKRLSFEEKNISSRLIYEGKIVSLKVDDVRLPDGNNGFREYVKHPGAAAVLAITDEKNVVLVRQYRYPVQQELVEIPAGKLESGEDPLECAQRELEEETGYQAKNFELLAKYYPNVGYSTEILYLYLATDLQKTYSQPEQEEFLEVVEYDRDKIKKILNKQTFIDSKTLIAFLFLQQLELI